MERGGGAMESVGGVGREPGPLPTAEEEALKRNTDCVYFLASPLTCKKGSECEYRHSEGARINPRDCFFWMNGNCLNPKCSFRHPPLGIPGTTPGPVPPPSQAVTPSMQIHVAHGPSAYGATKQNVPCYFFQKGQCLKGDKCTFMHGVQPAGNPVPQQVAKLSTFPSDPPTLNKDSFIKECTSQQSISKANVNKPVEVQPSSAKPFTIPESVPNNGSAIMQNAPPYLVEDELGRYQPSDIPVSSGNAISHPRSRQSQSIDERLQNGREGDEFLGESSPGFDVLVDDNVEESDYFHNEEDFARAAGQGGRNLNAANEFDYHHSDYEQVASFDREQFNGIGEYDRYGRVHGQYGREQRRPSLERILERPSLPERRSTKRESLDEIDGSDLRHRLMKQRRLNGSRPAVTPDHRGDRYRRDNDSAEEERRRGHHPRRDQRRAPVESSISSRLQGRLKLPLRSSPDRPANLWSERDRDRDRGRHRGRLSPGRPINNQGRHHDRIKRRSHENVSSSDERNYEGHPIRKNETGVLDFAGPKSLAELKGAKVSDNTPRRRSMISGKDVAHQDSEGTVSFDGPKPLSIILKRKRDAADNGSILSSGDENNESGAEGMTGNPASVAVSDLQQVLHSSEAEKEGKHPVTYPSEHKVTSTDEEEEEGQIPTEDDGLHYHGQSLIEGNEREAEDAVVVDAMDYQELENYEQRDGEYDYEAAEGGDFKTEDDEKPYQEDEDDDDDDDFAKKVGVMFS